MKKIGNIVRWIIGILIIVIGLALSTESAIAGILWALVGLINLPPITKKIPQFKGRTPVLVVGCIVLIFVGIASFGTTEQSSQLSQGQQNISDTPSTPSPVTTESDSLDTETAGELRQWINNSISTVNGHISASNSAIKKWSKIPEQDFLPIWESVVLDHLRSTEQFSSMVTYLKSAASLYTSLYNDNAKIAWIKQLTNDLSESDTANKELLKKYPFDLLTESPVHGTFYITQRLETSYSDNILGALQKEFDSYQAKSTSDWVAYDVEYSFGTASRGDTFRIIHADSLNPFTQSGAYEVYYVDTGTTTETVDMQGFRNTVPVYQLIENLDEAHYDLEEYQKNRNQCLTYLEELK